MKARNLRKVEYNGTKEEYEKKKLTWTCKAYLSTIILLGDVNARTTIELDSMITLGTTPMLETFLLHHKLVGSKRHFHHFLTPSQRSIMCNTKNLRTIIYMPWPHQKKKKKPLACTFVGLQIQRGLSMQWPCLCLSNWHTCSTLIISSSFMV